MSNQVHVQNLRGNTAKNNNYLGNEGEIVVNLESHSLRIHDGVEQGGYGTVYAASSETVAYAAMKDLAEGAIVVVGTSAPFKLYQKSGENLVLKDLEADVDIYKGVIKTEGEEGKLEIRKVGEDFYFDMTFPFIEAVVNKGIVKVEGITGSLSVTKNGTNNYTIDATFPEVPVPSDVAPKTPAADAIAGTSKDFARADHQHPLEFEKGTVTHDTETDLSFERDGHKVKLNFVAPEYTGHTTSESESETMAEKMPEGGIIIERVAGEKPLLKQKVNGSLEATKIGGIQATYTDDAAGTTAILPHIEDGALIVEGPGPLIINADVPISAVSGNTLERRADGLFHPKNTAITANAAETEALLPTLAEGTIIIEGPGEILVETAARVSKAPNNAIEEKADGIFVEATKELTEEHKTNYTFNGKPVYRNRVQFTVPQATVNGTVVQNITPLNISDIDAIVKCDGYLSNSDDSVIRSMPIIFSGGAQTRTWIVSCSRTEIKAANSWIDRNNDAAYAIIEYTKVTD